MLGDNCCLHLIGGSVFDPGNSDLSHWPTALKSLAFFGSHVSAFASYVSFVNFDRARERWIAVRTCPGFADAVQHEPGRGLGHFDITSQLRTSDALQASQFQVDGDCPLPQREVGFGDGGSSADAEVFSAVRAPIRHRLSAGGLYGPSGSATPTTSLVRPQGLLEPCLGGFLRGKHSHELNQPDLLSLSFLSPFHHTNIVTHGGSLVK